MLLTFFFGGRCGSLSGFCLELVAIAFLLTLALCGLNADLLVVLLQGGQVFPSLAELSLLHAFADIPVHESALRVHQVKLVVNAREHLSDGGGVADHAECAHHLCKIASGNHSRWLIVDAALEACWAPIHELDGALGLDGGHSG